MTEPAAPRRRRRWPWVLLAVAALLVATVVLLPRLVTDEVLRARVETDLAAMLGRPVRLASARLRWREAEIVCTDLEIGGRTGRPGDLLARADRLLVRLDVASLARVLTRGEADLESVRLEGLELWLIRGEDGAWNVADLAAGGGEDQAAVPSVQVSHGTVHVVNRPLGRELTLTELSASLGRLAATGQGYLRADARVPGGPEGRAAVTASFAREAAGTAPAGSASAEWHDVGWAEVAGLVTRDAALAALAGRASGRLGLTFAPDGWSAEGSIEADRLVLGAPADEAAAGAAPGGGEEAPRVAVRLARPVVGFKVERWPLDGRLQVHRLALTAPGFSVRASGSVANLPTGDADAAAPFRPRVTMRGEGTVAWDLLARGVAAVGAAAERLETFGGESTLRFSVSPSGGGHQVEATLALAQMEALGEGLVAKRAGRPLDLAVEASVPEAGPALLRRAALEGDAGRVTLRGPVPLDPARWEAAPLAVTVRLTEAEALWTLVPLVPAAVGGVRATGPLAADVTFRPGPDDGPPGWAVEATADLTETALRTPGGNTKAAGKAAVVTVRGGVSADGHLAHVTAVEGALGTGRVRWAGEARVARPADPDAAATGRFEGRLTLEGLEHLLPFLSLRFTGTATDAPVRGDVSVQIEGDLAGGKLAGRAAADLGAAGLGGGPRFRKPVGQAAAVDLEGTITFGVPHFADLAARVRLPGLEADVSTQSQFRVTAARDAGPEAAAPSHVAIQFGWGPLVRVQARARAADLAALAPLVPQAGDWLADHARGPGRADLNVFATPRKVSVSAMLDLPEAAVAWAPYLAKPAGEAAQVSVAADAVPTVTPDGEPVFACETTVHAQLGASSATAAGQVLVRSPGTLATLVSAAQGLALVRRADLEIEATVEHGPALGAAVPAVGRWYARGRLEGPMAVTARVTGTPLRGTVRLDVNAIDCRAMEADTVTKAAGTTARLQLAADYGQVPGEVHVAGLDLAIGEARVTAQGRLFFDDPDLLTPQAPAAYRVSLKGTAPDLAALAPVLPGWARGLAPSGGLRFDAAVAGDAYGLGIERLDLEMDGASLVWLGRPVALAGPLTFDGRRLASDGLAIRVGRSDVRLVGYAIHPGLAPTGSVFVRGERVDVEELEALIGETTARVARRAGPPAEADTEAEAGGLRQVLARQLQRALGRALVTGDVELGTLSLYVPKLDARYELKDLKTAVRLAGGRFSLPAFTCGLNEGTVSGELAIDFRLSPPVLSVAYDARDLAMAENLRPFVETMFPGMEVTGSLSQKQAFQQALEAGSHPVGQGETVLVTGLLRGPAAPDYVTHLFPGLKLTTYRFREMSNVFENEPGGTVRNRMIFDGEDYDIYIFGHTEADGTFVYTLGVDLSLSLGSETWTRTLEQGKIPLMRYSGRIEGTAYAERDIRYVLPHELAYDVFVEKSLLVQLIKSLGHKPPDLSKPPELPEE